MNHPVQSASPAPLTVVINAYSARLGGGQTYLRNILAHLPADSGLRILFYGPSSIELPDHPGIERMHTAWPTTNPVLRAIWERLMLPQLLRRHRASVLFCPGGVVATAAPAGCKVVCMFRNMIPFDRDLVRRMPWGLQRLRNLILARVLLRSLAEADLAIFISNHARALIEGLRPIRNPITIPHGIGDAFRAKDVPVTRPATLPEGDYLLYVSRFDIYKHHAEVVQAYAALPDRVRSRYRLVLLGEKNLPEATRVAAMVSELGLAAHVWMPGAVPNGELPAYYRHAHAIIFASSCENCPNILLESLGAGRPVLSSDVMPMPEFGGPDLLYFSPTHPESLSGQLLDVLEQPHLAAKVAAAARTRSKLYSWEITAAATWQAIRQLGSNAEQTS